MNYKKESYYLIKKIDEFFEEVINNKEPLNLEEEKALQLLMIRLTEFNTLLTVILYSNNDDLNKNSNTFKNIIHDSKSYVNIIK